MIKRDTILVDRVTDGEKCGYDCRFDLGWDRCELFRQNIRRQGEVSRCPACLSTPPAVALTEEMENVLRGVAAMMKLDWNTRQSHDAVDVLRAALPTIFGGEE